LLIQTETKSALCEEANIGKAYSTQRPDNKSNRSRKSKKKERERLFERPKIRRKYNVMNRKEIWLD